ncbi:hypothetical protein [Streptomyces sp. NPDC057293]|uniref:hypothetical protein n=1 Tax=unclassified Streptomyces TaxID=2593676 RepID=UPI003624F99C
MSQQDAPQPGQSGPQPAKKRSVGRIAGLGCAGVIGLVAVIGIAGSMGDPDNASGPGTTDKAIAADSKARTENERRTGEPSSTQAEEFQDCVGESGTATEKKAAQHITKVTGADRRNDILDSAEVFTDFSGGMMGPHQGEGKLIASAFVSCYDSDNGLVTVYDKDGEVLANANY